MGLSVLTLNCWGILGASPRRQQRILAIGNVISKARHHDFILLQEVWVSEDARYLAKCGTAAGLCFSVHYKSGMFGAGLLTLSRYPIEDFAFHQFLAAGDPLKIHRCDFYTKKGVGWARVLSPVGTIDLFNTHLHANYCHSSVAHCGAWRIPSDADAPYRLSQILELAQVIHHFSKLGSIGAILCGDLNTKPDFLEYGLLRQLLPDFVDAWEVVHGPAQELGHTACETKSSVGERIDYIMSNMTPHKCEVTLKAGPDGQAYSDHFAVTARILPKPFRPASSRQATRAASCPTGADPFPLPLPHSAPVTQKLAVTAPHPRTQRLSTSGEHSTVQRSCSPLSRVSLQPDNRAGCVDAGRISNTSLSDFDRCWQEDDDTFDLLQDSLSPRLNAISPPKRGAIRSGMLQIESFTAKRRRDQGDRDEDANSEGIASNHTVQGLAVLKCCARILSMGVRRCRRDTMRRLVNGLICGIISLLWSSWLASSHQPECPRAYILAVLFYLAFPVIGPLFAFASAALLIMGAFVDPSQEQALLQAGTDRMALLISNSMSARKRL